MGENQARRQARRQQRGMLRVEEILQAAGVLFAERGYDKVTTNMIAARAGVSPGSLYQFFPNKEAIAQAFAADATEHLHRVYDTLLSSEVMILPLQVFVDTFVEVIIAFNRNYPGYLALELGSTLSSSLALVLAEFQQGLQTRLDALLAAYWPHSTPQQRQLPLLVSYRLLLAGLPPVRQGGEAEQPALRRGLTAALGWSWELSVDTRRAVALH